MPSAAFGSATCWAWLMSAEDVELAAGMVSTTFSVAIVDVSWYNSRSAESGICDGDNDVGRRLNLRNGPILKRHFPWPVKDNGFHGLARHDCG